MWQELCGEAPEGSSMACAAASAAASLAHGGPLPPGTTAAVRRNSVPGLLSLDVHLPPWEQQMMQQGGQERAASSSGGASSGAGLRRPASQPAAVESEQGPASAFAAAAQALAGGSPCVSSDRQDGTMLHMALGSGGRRQGSCTFTLSSPASAAERQHLALFCGQLGCELERARQHRAKQELEVRVGVGRRVGGGRARVAEGLGQGGFACTALQLALPALGSPCRGAATQRPCNHHDARV